MDLGLGVLDAAALFQQKDAVLDQGADDLGLLADERLKDVSLGGEIQGGQDRRGQRAQDDDMQDDLRPERPMTDLRGHFLVSAVARSEWSGL